MVLSQTTKNYSGNLIKSSRNYRRPGGTNGLYFYDTFNVTCNVTGLFEFTSTSGTDIYGYFYNSRFNATSPTFNLMKQDDDSGGRFQFKFNVSLRVGSIYILLVTTFKPDVMVSYSVRQSGPLSPPTPTPPPTTITTSRRTTIATTTTTRTTTTPRTTKTTACKSLYLEEIGLIKSYRYLYQFFPRLCISGSF